MKLGAIKPVMGDDEADGFMLLGGIADTQVGGGAGALIYGGGANPLNRRPRSTARPQAQSGGGSGGGTGGGGGGRSDRPRTLPV